MKTLIRYIGLWLLVAGCLIFSFPLVTWVYGYGFQLYHRRQFPPTATAPLPNTPSASSSNPTPFSPAVPAHSVIGRLEIPTLDISVMVVEGDDDGDLVRGAGHIPGTAIPGAPGNVAIAGHRDTFFRPLRKIHPGDPINLTTDRGAYRYIVESTEVTDPSNVSVLQAGSSPELTLVTCYPFSYVGPAPERFIVHARQAF